MSRDWARLGAELKAARERRQLRQEDIATELGVTRGAIANIDGGRFSRLTRTVRDYARLVGWADGSADAVLDGGEPAEGEAPGQDLSGKPRDLSDRVLQALAEGELIGSRVMHVQGPDGEVTATLVVRGSAGMSAEEVQRELVAWLSTGPVLRTPSGDAVSDDPSDSDI
jgi:transcriptional regulator with XRE-family HTH domain